MFAYRRTDVKKHQKEIKHRAYNIRFHDDAKRIGAREAAHSTKAKTKKYAY